MTVLSLSTGSRGKFVGNWIEYLSVTARESRENNSSGSAAVDKTLVRQRNNKANTMDDEEEHEEEVMGCSWRAR